MKIDFQQVEKVKTSDILEKETKSVEAKLYLAETDWYVLRFVETGETVPKAVSEKRADARNDIKEYQDAIK